MSFSHLANAADIMQDTHLGFSHNREPWVNVILGCLVSFFSVGSNRNFYEVKNKNSM